MAFRRSNDPITLNVPSTALRGNQIPPPAIHSSVPLIAGLIWYGWGRKSENWILYAAFLAAALALPVGALLMVLVGWIPVALGAKPIVVGAAFWTAAALVILRQITLMRKKEN